MCSGKYSSFLFRHPFLIAFMCLDKSGIFLVCEIILALRCVKVLTYQVPLFVPQWVSKSRLDPTCYNALMMNTTLLPLVFVLLFDPMYLEFSKVYIFKSKDKFNLFRYSFKVKILNYEIKNQFYRCLPYSIPYSPFSESSSVGLFVCPSSCP